VEFEEIIKAIPFEPYYRDPMADIAIFNADCRDILPYIPDTKDSNSSIILITDPPYGINLNLKWLSELNVAHSKPANKLDKPILGDSGMTLDFLFDYHKRAIFGFPYIYDPNATGWLVWDKQPGIDTDRTLTSPIEMLSTTLWKGFRLVRCMWAGYMRDNGEHRFAHPTQKPQKVIDYVILKSEGIILDPFLGSGTTCVCAKKLGRKCIGIEIEEKYCEIAAKRCCQMVMNLEAR